MFLSQKVLEAVLSNLVHTYATRWAKELSQIIINYAHIDLHFDNKLMGKHLKLENENTILHHDTEGAVMWNAVADSRLCVVFSFPDDVKLKSIASLEDVISRKDGMITMKFCEILKEYKKALGERL